MRKSYYCFILFLFYKLFSAQSDNDIHQQLICNYLYSKEIEKAKKIIDSNFLSSGNNSKKIIGLIYLSDYYSMKSDETKKVNALEKARVLAQN